MYPDLVPAILIEDPVRYPVAEYVPLESVVIACVVEVPACVILIRAPDRSAALGAS